MSILGHYNNFFFAAHLLDIAMGFKTLRTILSSVTHNGKQVNGSTKPSRDRICNDSTADIVYKVLYINNDFTLTFLLCILNIFANIYPNFFLKCILLKQDMMSLSTSISVPICHLCTIFYCIGSNNVSTKSHSVLGCI